MDILLLDIETAPNLAYVWGLWKQNIAPNQVANSSYVLCWSAKWLGQDKLFFDSVHKSKPKMMLSRIHTMLDRADAVVHYNGKHFDIPTLNKEFLLYKLGPPSPYKEIDLLETCKRRFRFESNRLDSIAQRLGLGQKVRHEGHELWVKCMANEKQAWKTMEQYNRHDVELLETLYNRLIPWIDKHPNRGAHEDISCCPHCGEEEKLHQRGFQVTQMMKYRRYQCQSCGAWFRGNRSVTTNKERMATIPA